MRVVDVEFRPERGRDGSGNVAIMGVPDLEALPLFRVAVEIDGGRGLGFASSRLMPDREALRVSGSPLVGSSPRKALLVRNNSGFSSGRLVPLRRGVDWADMVRFDWCGLEVGPPRARDDAVRAIVGPSAGLFPPLDGTAKADRTGDDAIIGDPTLEVAVPALLLPFTATPFVFFGFLLLSAPEAVGLLGMLRKTVLIDFSIRGPPFTGNGDGFSVFHFLTPTGLIPRPAPAMLSFGFLLF